MSLGSYNGHSGVKREQVMRLVNRKWDSGEWVRPTWCTVCGQDEGTIHGHHEDYDKPDEYVPLCITCHLVLHCRFRNDLVWDQYRRWVREGWQFPPLEQRTAFGALQRGLLAGRFPDGAVKVNPPKRATYLDTIGNS